MKLQDFDIKGLNGAANPLPDCEGKVVLVVNVASKCGLTPQYEALEHLYQELKDDGLVVLGLPCNQFAGQEPGSEQQIQTFCETRFDVSFPMTEKIDVNGPGRHPIYTWLTGSDYGMEGDIKWNFEKFLVGRDGVPVRRFSPKTAPDDLDVLEGIEALL